MKNVINYEFESTTDMMAASFGSLDFANNVYKVKTLGYYSANDGGGAEFELKSQCPTGETAGDIGGLIQLNTNLYAKQIVENCTVDIKQFGARTGSGFDSSESINFAIKFVHENLGKGINNVVFSSGHYYIANQIKINPYVRVVLKGTVIITTMTSFLLDANRDHLNETFYDCNGNAVTGTLDWIHNVYCVKRPLSGGNYALYRYTKAAILIAYDTLTEDDQAVPDSHPLVPSSPIIANKNAYVISGEGSLHINALYNSENTDSNADINENQYPTYMVGVEIGTADTAYRKSKYSDPGQYNNIRFEKISVHDFCVGMLIHTTNFYSNRFHNLSFKGNYIGLQFGFMPHGGQTIQEPSVNSGELIIVKDSVFTGNIIDVELNKVGSELDFIGCHFDYSNCAFHITSYEKVFLDHCHIEGIGRKIIEKVFKSASPYDSHETVGSIDISDYAPYGILYFENAVYKTAIEIRDSIIVEQNCAFFPHFNFPSSYENSDGHYGNSLVLDSVKYGVGGTHITSFKVNQYDGIGPITGTVYSGFLTSEVANLPFDKTKNLVMSTACRNSVPVTYLNSNSLTPSLTDPFVKTHFTYAMRPMNNKALLLNNTYFQDENGYTLGSGGTDYSGTVISGENVPINFRAYDANAKYVEIVNNKHENILFPIDFNEEIICNYGDTFYGQIVTNKIQRDYNSQYINIAAHQVVFKEYDQNGNIIEAYSYAVSYYISDNLATDAGVLLLNEKFPYPATTAAVHKIQNRNCRKIKVTVFAAVSSRTEDPESTSNTLQVHGVFVYRQ